MNSGKLLIVGELDPINDNTNFIINMPIDNIEWFEDVTGKSGNIYHGQISFKKVNDNIDDFLLEPFCISNSSIKGLEFYRTYDNTNVLDEEYYNLNLSINNLNHDERTIYLCLMLVNDDNTESLLDDNIMIIKNINLKYKILGKHLKSYNRIRLHIHAEDPYWIPKQSIGLDIFNIYI